MKERKLEIYILRHGTTEWNRVYRIQGRTDTALDPLGEEMARYTGEYFRREGISFDRVFSSPLERARKTAGFVAGEEMILDQRLCELSFGRLEGKTINDMKAEGIPFYLFAEDPAEYDRFAAGEPSMETLTGLCARTAEFMVEMVEKNTELKDTDRILISAHGACNNGLLMHIRGEKDLTRFWENGLQPNCGVDVVNYDRAKGEYRILEENRFFYPAELKGNTGNLIM